MEWGFCGIRKNKILRTLNEAVQHLPLIEEAGEQFQVSWNEEHFRPSVNDRLLPTLTTGSLPLTA